MAGERLDAARHALEALVVRLDPSDAFGLVAFDDEVQVTLPAAPLGRRLSQGDGAGGARLMREAALAVPAAAAPELLAEAALLQSLADQRDVRVAAKTLRADLHRKTQRRRR
jgi:hypothetical protein